jgi:hypothetical protein
MTKSHRTPKHTVRRMGPTDRETPRPEPKVREARVIKSAEGLPVSVSKRTDGFIVIRVGDVQVTVNALELQEALR